MINSDLSVTQQYLAETEIESNVSYLLPELNLVSGCKYTLTKTTFGLVNGTTVILKHIITIMKK